MVLDPSNISNLEQLALKGLILPGADPDICLGGPALPLPSPPLLSFSPPLSLKSRIPLNQLEGLGSALSSTVGSGAEPRPKTNLVHSKSHWWQSFWVFCSACFTAERSKFSTRRNTVPFSLIKSTVTASVTAKQRMVKFREMSPSKGKGKKRERIREKESLRREWKTPWRMSVCCKRSFSYFKVKLHKAILSLGSLGEGGNT